ncbi:MAG: hypothetical protein N3J91_01610 [Verrucomicrobiae bacterium]|nr:hypothetical protein [Verrucomicrobiae bacterium]
MGKIWRVIAVAVAVKALVLMLAATGLYCAGVWSQEAMKHALSAGTVIWFGAALPLRFLGNREP